MEKIEFAGKNLEEVLAQASLHFGVEKTFINYNVIGTNSSGGLLSRIFSRGVKIEAWIEKTQDDLKAQARAAVRGLFEKDSGAQNKNQSPKKNQPPQKQNVLNNHVVQNQAPAAQEVSFETPGVRSEFDAYNKNFFKAFDLDDSKYHAQLDAGSKNMNVSIECRALESFLEKSDKLSVAYEHVFKRICQKKFGDLETRVTLNAGESNNKHKEKLTQMALSLADKVKKSGKSIALSSKSSAERRVIHMTLDSIEGIGTRSVGSGENRKLIIFALKSREEASSSSGNPKRPQKQPGEAAGKRPVKHKPRFQPKTKQSPAKS